MKFVKYFALKQIVNQQHNLIDLYIRDPKLARLTPHQIKSGLWEPILNGMMSEYRTHMK